MRSVLLALAALVAPALVAAQDPLLYVTFHGGSGGVNTISSFQLDGTPVTAAVLVGDANADGQTHRQEGKERQGGADDRMIDRDAMAPSVCFSLCLSSLLLLNLELRSAVILPDGTLLVANAHKTSSSLGHYDGCAADGTRQYLEDWATTHVSHPYGLAVGASASQGQETVVWATNQDTYDVVQFGLASAAWQSQIGQFGTNELRGLAFDANSEKGTLYVANEDTNSVMAYHTVTDEWEPAAFPNITDPVGLFIDIDARQIFIGSNGGTSAASNVFLYDLDTRDLTQTYTDAGLQHPAGMVSYNGQLFVLSQTAGTLMQFDIDSGKLVATPITSFADTPEQLVLSPC